MTRRDQSADFTKTLWNFSRNIENKSWNGQVKLTHFRATFHFSPFPLKSLARDGLMQCAKKMSWNNLHNLLEKITVQSTLLILLPCWVHLSFADLSEAISQKQFLCLKTRKLELQSNSAAFTTQKLKFFIKDFFSKCDHIRSFLRIWSHLLIKNL